MSATFDPPQNSYEGFWNYVMSWSTLDVIEEYFNDDWRKGGEIRRVVITQRLYQTSPSSTQVRFSKA